MKDADLTFIAKKLDHVLTELGYFRDETAVQTAMIVRLDATVDGLKQEVRALHSQNARIEKRVHVLEEASSK